MNSSSHNPSGGTSTVSSFQWIWSVWTSWAVVLAMKQVTFLADRGRTPLLWQQDMSHTADTAGAMGASSQEQLDTSARYSTSPFHTYLLQGHGAHGFAAAMLGLLGIPSVTLPTTHDSQLVPLGLGHWLLEISWATWLLWLPQLSMAHVFCVDFPRVLREKQNSNYMREKYFFCKAINNLVQRC